MFSSKPLRLGDLMPYRNQELFFRITYPWRHERPFIYCGVVDEMTTPLIGKKGLVQLITFTLTWRVEVRKVLKVTSAADIRTHRPIPRSLRRSPLPFRLDRPYRELKGPILRIYDERDQVEISPSGELKEFVERMYAEY